LIPTRRGAVRDQWGRDLPIWRDADGRGPAELAARSGFSAPALAAGGGQIRMSIAPNTSFRYCRNQTATPSCSSSPPAAGSPWPATPWRTASCRSPGPRRSRKGT